MDRCFKVEGEFFLVEPLSNEIFYLDAVSSGLWRLLESPQKTEDLIATLQAAFPEQPEDQIAADATRMIEELQAAGLVRDSR